MAAKKKARLNFDEVVGLAKTFVASPSKNNQKAFLAAARHLDRGERKQIAGRMPAAHQQKIESVLTF